MQSERRAGLIPGLTGWHVMWSPAEVNRFLSGAKHDVPRQMLAGHWWTGFLAQLEATSMTHLFVCLFFISLLLPCNCD